MIDIDVRALQIKRLDEFRLANLHRREKTQGYRMMPWEIALGDKVDIKTFYGVSVKGKSGRKALRSWIETVRQVVGRFCRERGLSPSIDDIESLHAFDDIVWRSDLDFHARSATPAKAAREWFQP